MFMWKKDSAAEVCSTYGQKEAPELYSALKSEERWPVEWDDLLKKTEVKLLERTTTLLQHLF